MTEKSGGAVVSQSVSQTGGRVSWVCSMDCTNVKSPVASLTFACSSVRKRVRVTMLVLILSDSASPLALEWVRLEGMVAVDGYLSRRKATRAIWERQASYLKSRDESQSAI